MINLSTRERCYRNRKAVTAERIYKLIQINSKMLKFKKQGKSTENPTRDRHAKGPQNGSSVVGEGKRTMDSN